MISDNVINVTTVVIAVVTVTVVIATTIDQNAGVFVTRNRGSPV